MNVLLTYSRGLLFPFLVSYGTASLSLWSWESFFSGSMDKKSGLWPMTRGSVKCVRAVSFPWHESWDAWGILHGLLEVG